MTPYQEKAWDCLKEKERQCLFLAISENKSTCEASQLMGMTHYKYMELKERAEKFFRLFSDFFENTRQYLDQIVLVNSNLGII